MYPLGGLGSRWSAADAIHSSHDEETRRRRSPSFSSSSSRCSVIDDGRQSSAAISLTDMLREEGKRFRCYELEGRREAVLLRRTCHDENLERSQTGPPNGFDSRSRVLESGMPSEWSKMRPASRTHWGCPRRGEEGREESPRREVASCWTLSNETSNPNHIDPAYENASGLQLTPSNGAQVLIWITR